MQWLNQPPFYCNSWLRRSQMQAGLGWVVLLLLMGLIEVTQGYTFGGWAGLEGTPQPTHMPGALTEMASSPGPAETVHGSTCMRLLHHGGLGCLDFSHGSSQPWKQVFHQLSGSCMAFYDLALEVTEFHFHHPIGASSQEQVSENLQPYFKITSRTKASLWG